MRNTRKAEAEDLNKGKSQLWQYEKLAMICQTTAENRP